MELFCLVFNTLLIKLFHKRPEQLLNVAQNAQLLLQ